MVSPRSQYGKEGEALVVSHLKNDGFTILAQNYFKKFGEIDIIAKKEDVLIFVEVKSRRSSYFELCSLVPFSKQKKIIMVAKEYIVRNNHNNIMCRFDVALVQGTPPYHTLTYMPNAFIETERM